MTDLNKESEAFLGFLRTKGVVKVGWNSLGVLTNLVREAGCTLSYNDIELMQEVWMEKAKAQAVPDTHIVVPKQPTPKMIDATWDFDDEIIEMSSNTRNEFIWKKMVEASESGAEG
ncbi:MULTISPECIES: hypothetical protein [Acinetobacter]|uniref:hypothetical protein n=1 Tax=Acinetobacter TaxID=469 RepID=UPI0021CD88B5|nr:MULTISPECIES: hypothetical protein [Acinetobacter]MCU4455011.1 hypothetical protein [Acinetobacter nosocomialis]MCU4575481.1 hypothetical protein [Acinetobacter nosocomialis]MDU5771893.1 hypothetical protein [Acinetobacter sp.]MDU5862467.1 hypothetical protein [Acinetobacter sp.]